MGLKCSVLGHKYGDATVERDREEQGSEVVITIREIETCSRCDEERIVSENKEVTTLATPDEPADAEETDVEDENVAEPAVDSSPDDTVDESNEPSGVDESPPVDATEGAEILDAEDDAPVEDSADDELTDPSIEDAGLASEPMGEESVTEDAVIIDEDDPATEDDEPERAPGAWPEEPDDGDEEGGWSPSDDADEPPIRAPDAGTENNTAVTIPDGQFRCPECDYTTLVEDSSLRAGDFCPDCHKGSLVHEPRNGTRKE